MKMDEAGEVILKILVRALIKIALGQVQFGLGCRTNTLLEIQMHPGRLE
jgi:hypothetical protein